MGNIGPARVRYDVLPVPDLTSADLEPFRLTVPQPEPMPTPTPEPMPTPGPSPDPTVPDPTPLPPDPPPGAARMAGATG